MKALLTLAMKGRGQAVMAIVVSAMLALLISPLSIVSNGLVVLATLRNGPREGLLVVVLSAAAMAVLGGLIFRAPQVLGLLGLMAWLPAWGLATVLGRSGSLARTLEVAAVLGMLVVAAQYLWLGDPAAFWGGLLQEYMQASWDPAVIPEAEQRALLHQLSTWMPGGIGAVWTLSMALAVFFARWGQALLAEPGAFGREFRQLRVSRPWLVVLPLLLVGGMFGEGPGLVGQLYVVVMVLFLLQGLSMAHALVTGAGASRGWLFGLYFLLIVGLPHSMTALAAAGYIDGWLDFRARLRGGGSPSGPE
ncbi:MAG: hypothetical protein D6720_07110 [Gammaproteobacteria bacterium]|nr:MAG: hypothetical protein D6720_07110 [Gammaproteobacteria bacterium]